MKMNFNILILITMLSSTLLTACNSISTSPTTELNHSTTSHNSSLNVLASTTFLANIAQNVAGERAVVTSLLSAGADPHSYQAAPTDVAKIAKSNLLILNGVEYEHFIEPLLENAGGERLVIETTAGLDILQMAKNDYAQKNEGHSHEAGDPHMWLDPSRVVKYVENIRDGLSQADPDGTEIYKVNAEAYIVQLNDLDKWIAEQVNSIPVERRLLVTNHETLSYFASHYGFTVVGAVIPSLSTEASSSAQQMAQLVEQIKATKAPAIFLGEVENPNIANQIAEETGVKIIKGLYLETLTDGAPASTYIDMMKYNVSIIVEALK